VVIRIGRSRWCDACLTASSGSRSVLALEPQGDVDDHDAVLLDDADQQDDRDDADHVEVLAHGLQRQQRAHARRGQGREDGQRVDEALIEHAQDDVDGDQRGGDQDRLAGQRLLEGLRRALEGAGERSRRAQLVARGLHRLRRLAERHARREIERQGRGGNSPWWLTVRLLVPLGSTFTNSDSGTVPPVIGESRCTPS
jgi:hypothetical protein